MKNNELLKKKIPAQNSWCAPGRDKKQLRNFRRLPEGKGK